MDSTWAPQSPDLSSHDSTEPDAPVHPQHAGYRGSISHISPFVETPSSLSQPTPALPQSSMPRGVRKDESMPDADYQPTSTDIVIKNHFPVARIKRIMQADDDVGKVAQVTPVVVSKALELFMISLVTKAAAEAKSRNSKRVGAVHLKQAISNNVQFDFLNDIVSKVADAPEKSDGDAVDPDGKKKKTSGRRKKKAADSDDDF